MNENYKQLKSVGQGEDISALKNNIDKVFYNNNEDNVEYWTGLPWMKIWSDSNISMIKDVRVPVTNFTVPESIEEYLWDIGKTVNPNNLTKALIINGDTYYGIYVRLKELDITQNNVTYYAWFDNRQPDDAFITFTTEDYTKGKHTGNYYEGQITSFGPSIGTLHTNMSITVTNYIYSQQTVSYGKCDGKKVKLYSSDFSLDNMASGLTKVELSEGVTKIGKMAFRNCTELREIKLPTSITSIVNNAFTGCTNLTAIYYKGNATGAPWGASNATVINE